MAATRKIDEIDAKILKELLKDGRRKFIEIAKEAKVSEDVIWQHYINMQKEGIIIGATIQLNYAALGYDVAASFFVHIPPRQQQQTIEQLRKIPGLYDAYQCGSPSILWVVSDFTRTSEIEKTKTAIGKLPSVLKSEAEVWAGLRNLPENLSVLINGRTSSDPKKKTETQTKTEIEGSAGKILREIDDVDRQIIEKLTVDGRASFNAIGKELGISTSTAIRRYRNLKRNGILKVLIQVNPAKLGYSTSALFRLTIGADGNLDSIIEEIAKIPDINSVIKTIGVYDLTLIAKIKNLEHLSTLETEIANIKGFKDMAPAALSSFPILPYPREHMSTF